MKLDCLESQPEICFFLGGVLRGNPETCPFMCSSQPVFKVGVPELISWAALDKLINLSVLHFPYLQSFFCLSAGIILLMLTNVERPSPLWASPFPTVREGP